MMTCKYLFSLGVFSRVGPLKHPLSKSITTASGTELTQPKVGPISDLDIPDFYRSKSVFITGGTGFMGKVLVERLLSTCPDIGNLYLLMREKEGLSCDARLQQLKESQLFNVLRTRDPRQLDKILAVNGNLSSNHLGLGKTDREQINKVSVVFHMAASLRFNEPLPASVDSNLRPTMKILQLCDTLPKLDAFVFVSTCYSNAEHYRVEERVYPPPMALNTLLDMVKSQELTKEESEKIVSPKLNSYTFTKAMAEYVVDLHGCKDYPTAIFRPAMVISSSRYPFPGWIETMNGVSGAVASISSGLLRVFSLRRSARADLVPVDITTDTLIAAAWETASDKPKDVRVYNCADCENPISWGSFVDITNEHAVRFPSKNVVWWPRLYVTHNRYLYIILEFFMQTVPHSVIAHTARLLRLKSGANLLELNQQNKKKNNTFQSFTTNEWEFVCENFKRLRRRLSLKDRRVFNLDPTTIDWDDHLLGLVKGTRRHVLKETDDSLDSARERVRRIGFIITATKGACILAGISTFYFHVLMA